MLAELLVRVGAVVSGLLAVATLAFVGRAQLRRLREDFGARLRGAAPYLVLLGGILAINSVVRDVNDEVSWLVGWYITDHLARLEGGFVAWLQTFEMAELNAYFSFVYIYGYIFLLVFPIVAYFALENRRYLREACLAYSLNYGIGLVFYVMFIAYGPRQQLPEVESLLYTYWPQSQLLTGEANIPTNVFPSLHSSLSVTVALLAVKTRRQYPVWTVVAGVFATSVVVSTMYLGIHWATDVVAGAGLAVFSVWAAPRLDDHLRARDWRDGYTGWFVRRLERIEDRLRGFVAQRR